MNTGTRVIIEEPIIFDGKIALAMGLPYSLVQKGNCTENGREIIKSGYEGRSGRASQRADLGYPLAALELGYRTRVGCG